MDKIKKVKIKRADGTFSAPIDLGANAVNIDLANGKNVEENFLGYNKVYNSKIDMVADAKNIINGMKVRTLGYYEINDGGGAEYYITNIKSITEFQEDLGNGLYAELIVNDSLNVKQIGAKGDGIQNDTIYLQHALNFYGKIIIPNGTYIVTKELVAKSKRLYLAGQGELTTIIKFIGIPSSETNLLSLSEKTERGIIENINFISDDESKEIPTYVNRKINGLNFNNSSYNVIRRCRFKGFKSGVKLHNSWTNNFNDCYFIRNNIGLDSKDGSNNNNITINNSQFEYNNYGAYMGEGRNVSFYACDIEHNLSYGIRKENEGDIQIINSYFEDQINLGYGLTYSSNMLVEGCSFFQNQSYDKLQRKAFTFITYGGDSKNTKIQISNCNFKNLCELPETYNTFCILQSNNASSIHPTLIENSVYQMKEINPEKFKGAIIKSGKILNYGYYYPSNYYNLENGTTVNLETNDQTKYKLNIYESGASTINLPVINNENKYAQDTINLLIPPQVSQSISWTGTIKSLNSNDTLYGETTLTQKDAGKLIKIILLDYRENTGCRWFIKKI